MLAAVEVDLEDRVRTAVKQKLAQLGVASKNLRKHRNKRIAHFDLEHAIKVKQLEAATNGELEDALELIRSIMKDIWLARFGSSVWYDPHLAYGCDGEFLLEILRRAHTNKTIK